jgi:hypothetical protein
MPAKKKIIEVPEIEILGTQDKKSAAARQAEIRKTGEYIRAHKQANTGKIKKAS